jgi:UDP-N-acetylglucosamine:LPS N-acetylglucosamine transferase
MPMNTIDLVYFNAGGGHRAAATALREAIQAQHKPWQVRLINLTEVLDARGRFRQLTGFEPEDLYNKRLARGWTLGISGDLKVLQAGIRLAHTAIVRTLQQHWLASKPDMVVSLIPNFNRALCESLASARPGAPFLTLMTDLADLPANFWIEPAQRQVIICGSPRALAQARDHGYDDAQLRLTSGMVLRPSFYQAATISREEGLLALGLDPAQPTAVVMFGGEGSRQMQRIARQLRDVQLILLCGRNEPLAESLRGAAQAHAARAVISYTADVARYMRLGDVFVGKPGPGCLSEAVHCGLPVLTVLDRWTMPQERYNAQWVLDHGYGKVVKSFYELRSAWLDMLPRLPEYRQRVARSDNRAVFEVIDIMQALLPVQKLHAVPEPRLAVLA